MHRGAGPCETDFCWEVDRTGPAVTLTGPSEGSTTGPNVSFMFTSEAGSTFRCSFDADARNQPPCPGSQASATLAAGGHRFSVTAFDDLGNAGEPAARSFSVDDTGPAVTVIPLPGNLSQSVGTLTYVSDPEVTFECKLDGDGFEPPFTTRETYRFVDAQ